MGFLSGVVTVLVLDQQPTNHSDCKTTPFPYLNLVLV